MLQKKPQAAGTDLRSFQTTKLLDDELPVPGEVITRLRGANKCHATAHHFSRCISIILYLTSWHNATVVNVLNRSVEITSFIFIPNYSLFYRIRKELMFYRDIM